jgi:hypothetical protein
MPLRQPPENTATIDEIARLTWRAHAEGQIPDAEAGAISEAIEARRAALAGKGPAEPPRLPLGRPRAVMKPERREKIFGLGRQPPAFLLFRLPSGLESAKSRPHTQNYPRAVTFEEAKKIHGPPRPLRRTARKAAPSDGRGPGVPPDANTA